MSVDSSRSGSINGWNADYVDEMYAKWLQDENSVDESWRLFFQGFELGNTRGGAAVGSEDDETACRLESLQSRVDSLIYHYRDVGHLIAKTDPLGRNLDSHPLLELEAFDLTEADLDSVFSAERVQWNGERMPLREILNALRETYCGSIGVEYMDIQNTPERRWLQQRMESTLNKPQLSAEERLEILDGLRKGTAFERFLHTNYVGQKRFSLEGGETLIPLLQAVISHGADHDVEEIVVGMAHRGRLNVLCNILRKSYEEIFSEFEDNYNPGMIMGDGDVKYHKGYSTDYELEGGRKVHLTLTANPSHLEAVDPVVLGRVRAKQRLLGDTERRRALGVLMHGDAAFAGQGVVAETLNLSQLQGYRTGGTIHIIVNNQIGFTTLPSDARSGGYCTDVAKMLQAPIFHVNGEDPEAVIHVARMAVEYRQTFQKDVVIDMYCYRRHGHNEGDEPSFTQPKMYEMIRSRETTLELYSKRLIEDGVATTEQLEQLDKELNEGMGAAQERARKNQIELRNQPFQQEWADYTHEYSHDVVKTGVSESLINDVAEVWAKWPEGFSPNKKVVRILSKRREAIQDPEVSLDWGTGEALAFGTLLAEGTPVRLSGQDSRRGTFSHRHAVVWDVNTAEMYIPLNHVKEGQARFCVYDSPLSEAAVLGFDYGYSLGNPDMLICWEAQFGDFVNGAQTIIDQFISSSESKWNRASGLVMLLPHGYEGQGPEHSNAFMERFLQLAAQDNMQVCNMTTPAQLFHVLRRQSKRNFRKPLIIMSPKSLLRHPRCVSPLEDFTGDTHFQEVMDDQGVKAADVKRIVLCSGKVYYDLLERRENEGITDTALIRMEQIYPFPADQLRAVMDRYGKAKEFVWCQEEPKNRGAWGFVSSELEETLGVRFRYVGRNRSASPAVGSLKRHQAEQAEVLAAALPSKGAAAASEPEPVGARSRAK